MISITSEARFTIFGARFIIYMVPKNIDFSIPMYIVSGAHFIIIHGMYSFFILFVIVSERREKNDLSLYLYMYTGFLTDWRPAQNMKS